MNSFFLCRFVFQKCSLHMYVHNKPSLLEQVDEQLVEMVNEACALGGGDKATSTNSSSGNSSGNSSNIGITPDSFQLPRMWGAKKHGGGGSRGIGSGGGGGSKAASSSLSSSSAPSPPSSPFLAYPALKGLNKEELELRLLAARTLNQIAEKAMPLVRTAGQMVCLDVTSVFWLL